MEWNGVVASPKISVCGKHIVLLFTRITRFMMGTDD